MTTHAVNQPGQGCQQPQPLPRCSLCGVLVPSHDTTGSSGFPDFAGTDTACDCSARFAAAGAAVKCTAGRRRR